MRWAVFVPADRLPPILLQPHIDWPWPFRWVPRRWTTFVGMPPRMLWGNAPKIPHPWADGRGGGWETWIPKPIPDPGQWWIGTPPYLAFQTSGGWYFRIGFRYDDVDQYFTLAFTIKHYKKS